MERERKISKASQSSNSIIRRESTQRKISRTETMAFERALAKNKVNGNMHVEVFDSHAFDVHTVTKKEPVRRKLRRYNTLIDLAEKVGDLAEWSASENEEDENNKRRRSTSLPEGPGRHSVLGELANDDILQSPRGSQQSRDSQVTLNDKKSNGLDVIDLTSDEESTNEYSDNKSPDTRKKSTHKRISTVDDPLPPILETTKLTDDDKKPLSGAFEKRGSVIATLDLLRQQENEALVKLQLVKKIQSKARIRQSYKPYFSELGPVRKDRPPRKLAPIENKDKATDNEVNSTVNSEKEPLLDKRFVNLMRSLSKM